MPWQPGRNLAGVDPRLGAILQAAGNNFPYIVQPTSGFRPGDPRFHGKGMATDIEIIDPRTGQMIPNSKDPGSFNVYQQFANAARQAQQQLYPELSDKFRWGGYFSGGKSQYGALDLMHFDLGRSPSLGMAGGDWGTGLTPQQAKIWGLSPGTGGAVDPTMTASIPATASASYSPAAPTVGGRPGTQGAPSPIEAYIRQSALSRGIDPDTAVKVAMSEGGLNDPVRQSDYRNNGVRETSYGPFQLRIGGGLGDAALKAGVDPRDPNQWQKGVDFALDQVKSGGWGPWMGAKKQGITGMMGVGTTPATAGTAIASNATSPSSVTQSPAPTAMAAAQPAPQRVDLAGQMLGGVKDTLGSVGKAMTASAQNQPSLAGLAPDPVSLANAPDIASIDPQQAQIQQQRMALALQRLNAGRLV
jgi:hypothetical protein